MKYPSKTWLGLAAVALMATPGCDREPETPQIGSRFRTSPALQTFDSCDELAGALRTNLKEEMRATLLAQNGWWGMEDDTAIAAEGDTGGSSNGTGTRQEGVDYSGTNNQEAGVDEADFVKTDGYHIYVLNGNQLEIFGVPEFGQLVATSTTPVEGHPIQMLKHDNKMVVFSQIYAWNLPEEHPLVDVLGTAGDWGGWWYPVTTLTKATVIDITTPAAPQVSREIYLEGNYQTARKVGGTVRSASYAMTTVPGLRYWVEVPDAYWELDWDDPQREVIWNQAALNTIAVNNAIIDQASLGEFLPRLFERLTSAQFVEYPFSAGDCRRFSMSADGMSRGVSSLLTLDLFGTAFGFEHDHIVTNYSTVYASTDTLILAEPAHDWWWFWANGEFDDATNLHRFDISQEGVTTYTGSGRVDGSILDQFSLSEHNDFIRVAATTNRWGRWWDDTPAEPENHVYVLTGSEALAVVGHVGGIARGETIWSSRFVGDEGYLVTFRNIDPLWTIDLTVPTAPTIKGELEVPGVSTYIHPMEGEKLLTIGFGGDANGLDWTTQICMFDVGDFSHPSLASTLNLAPPSPDEGWSWAWSEASYEHKAFQYWAPKKLLAIPLSTYRWDYQTEYYEYYSRLQLITVDAANGTLTRYGDVDHSGFYNRDPYTYWGSRDIRRSIFMGDYIYAISSRGITAHKLDDLSLAASAELQGEGSMPYWWW